MRSSFLTSVMFSWSVISRSARSAVIEKRRLTRRRADRWRRNGPNSPGAGESVPSITKHSVASTVLNRALMTDRGAKLTDESPSPVSDEYPHSDYAPPTHQK